MDPEIIKALAEGGIGMLAIVVIIWFYRNDNIKQHKQWAEHCEKQDALWQENCRMLQGFLQDKRELIVADQETRERHTQVMTELVDLLKKLNGRVADIMTDAAGVKYGRRRDDRKEGHDGD